MKLIKYFLASLTIPEQDLWVNLSPYEKDRIVPQSFGQTEMGRDLLAQDYLLKQITASLIYPEDEFGKIFWKRVYEEANKRFGTTNIPVNTFNKVWIVPEKAVVYENAQAGTAYVVESRLKVMLEEDYLALANNQPPTRGHVPQNVSPSTLPTYQPLNPKASQGNPLNASPEINALGSQIVREIVIPALTKEINENKNFAQLRQVYNSLILATWYKKKIKDSILSQVYADKNKISGLTPTRGHVAGTASASNVSPSTLPTNPALNAKAPQGNPPNDVEAIYQQYLTAFKKGVYNYIKEEQDPVTRQMIPRKYFSGGVKFGDVAMVTTKDAAMLPQVASDHSAIVQTNLNPAGRAMAAIQDWERVRARAKISFFVKTFFIMGGTVIGASAFKHYSQNVYAVLAMGMLYGFTTFRFVMDDYLIGKSERAGDYITISRQPKERDSLGIHVVLNLKGLAGQQENAYTLIAEDVVKVVYELVANWKQEGGLKEVKYITGDSPLLVQERRGMGARFMPSIKRLLNKIGVGDEDIEVHKRQRTDKRQFMLWKILYPRVWMINNKTYSGRFRMNVSTPEAQQALLEKLRPVYDALNGVDPNDPEKMAKKRRILFGGSLARDEEAQVDDATASVQAGPDAAMSRSQQSENIKSIADWIDALKKDNYVLFHQTMDDSAERILQSYFKTSPQINGIAAVYTREILMGNLQWMSMSAGEFQRRRLEQDGPLGQIHKGANAIVVLVFPKKEFGGVDRFIRLFEVFEMIDEKIGGDWLQETGGMGVPNKYVAGYIHPTDQSIDVYINPNSVVKPLSDEHWGLLGVGNENLIVLRDQAIKSVMSKQSGPGGIDFKSDKVDSAFEIKREPEQMGTRNEYMSPFVDPVMLEQLQNAPGFVPVIINIQPMTDLRMFLGLQENKPEKEEAVL
ncbi:MAG: hypothetical protein Q7K71_06610 [Candidatus Omnitrophota bacterium]|nr:hypothetical protein [Candidatus Omnitrophota bacterium]